MFLKSLGLLLVAGLAASEPPVNNQYLPPDQGYTYNRPTVPFPSTQPPGLRPPPTYPGTSYPPPSPGYPPARPPPPSRPPSPPSPGYPTPGYPTPGYPTPGFPTQTPSRPPSRPTYPSPPPPTRPTYPPPSPPKPSYGPPITPGYPSQPTPPKPTYGPPGQGIPPTGGEHDHHHHHEPGMPFDFNYAVKDDYYGTDYSHNAISDGDVVRGEYRVALPDGRTQIVTYTADWQHGFNAEVKYEGEARYPDQVPGAFPPGGGSTYQPTGPAPFPGPKPSYGPPSAGY